MEVGNIAGDRLLIKHNDVFVESQKGVIKKSEENNVDDTFSFRFFVFS